MAKYKAKKRFPNFAHPGFLAFFLLFVTANIFLAGYLNSRDLDTKNSSAYQGETCNSLGQTRCVAGNQEECVGNMWQVYSCGGRGCINGACVATTPTPFAGMNCNNAAGRCVPSTSICPGTSTQSDCPAGQKCIAEATRCVTPTPVPGGCFLAGTKIATLEGETNIEDVEIGNQVLSFKSTEADQVNNSDVANVYKVTRDHFYKITTGKNTVSVTAEHPFYRGSDNYTNAEDLKVGDNIYLLTDNKLIADTVSEVEKVNQQVDAYNLTVNSDHTFFANGFAVHNKTVVLSQAPTLDAQCTQKYSSVYSSSAGGYVATSNNQAVPCNSGEVTLGGVSNAYCSVWYIKNVWCKTYIRATQIGTCCIRPNAYNQDQVRQDCGAGTQYTAYYGQPPTACTQVASFSTCKNERNSNCIRNWQQNVLASCNQQHGASNLVLQDAFSGSKQCDIMTETLGSYVLSKGSCCPSGY